MPGCLLTPCTATVLQPAWPKGLSAWRFELKYIPLGVAYAFWSGLGTVGWVLLGLLIWKHIRTRIFAHPPLEMLCSFRERVPLIHGGRTSRKPIDGFRRSPFARSPHLASAKFGFPVRLRLGLFIAHAPDMGTRCCCPSPPRACSSRNRSPFQVRRPRPV